MQKFKILALACAIAVSTASTAFAAEVKEGHIPLRPVFEAMGAEIKWDGATQTVTATSEGEEFKFKVGSSKMTVEGMEFELGTTILLEKGVTSADKAGLEKAFDIAITYDDATGKATIVKTPTTGTEPTTPVAPITGVATKEYKAEVKGTNDVVLITIDAKYPELDATVVGNGVAAINKAMEANVKEVVDLTAAGLKADAQKAYDDAMKAKTEFKPVVVSSGFTAKTLDKKNFSVTVEFADDFGGAHAIKAMEGYTFDMVSGKPVTANSFLQKTSSEVAAYARTLFKADIAANADKYLENATALVDAKDFAFDFYLDNGKVVFFAQPYAIAPYSSGYPTVAAK